MQEVRGNFVAKHMKKRHGSLHGAAGVKALAEQLADVKVESGLSGVAIALLAAGIVPAHLNEICSGVGELVNDTVNKVEQF